MRFFAAVASLSAVLAPATVLASDDHKVPGDSPLMFCPGKVVTDVVAIESVNLSPNPPQVGEDLVIAANGTVNQTIEKGAYVRLVVKLGLITLINVVRDVCEEVRNIDLKCPIQPGRLEIKKTVKFPSMIPSVRFSSYIWQKGIFTGCQGHYFTQADVYTDDDRPITCLNAHVNFTHNGVPNIEL